VAIDDDPTGSQAVHDVDVVFDAADEGEINAALQAAGSVCFVLTNSRSAPEQQAVEVNTRLGLALAALEETGPPVSIVSRGDSTLRGHVVAEIEALDSARARARGSGYDGVVFCPAFIEAGRITADDVQLARVGDRFVPVGETEYARDPAFGYTASNLRDFLSERSHGGIAARDVASIGLHDIRDGGPERVAALLQGAANRRYFVVNATEQTDLDIVALGVVTAQESGVSLLFRSGPSLVRALAGLEPAPPVDLRRIEPRPGHAANGVVFVGSHVARTSRQLSSLFEQKLAVPIELDVARLLADGDPASYAQDVGAAAAAALTRGNVVVYTSRAVATDAGDPSGLTLARQVSAALSAAAAVTRQARPAWIVAKGGITSHDVALSGLGIRRSRVVGQLLPGMISVHIAVTAPPEVLGTPYIVFPGNVGDDDSLAQAVRQLSSLP
jgi:uncharacterized protein YgbK (DUF1537 family)